MTAHGSEGSDTQDPQQNAGNVLFHFHLPFFSFQFIDQAVDLSFLS